LGKIEREREERLILRKSKRKRERQLDRNFEILIDRQTDTGRERDRQTDTGRERDRQTDTGRGRDRQKLREERE
jgi:hypothetical protein